MLCPKCGAFRAPKDRFCGGCGALLADASPARAPAGRRPGRGGLLLLSSLGTGLTLCALVLGVFLLRPGPRADCGFTLPGGDVPFFLYTHKTVYCYNGAREVAALGSPRSMSQSLDRRVASCVDDEGRLWRVTVNGAEPAGTDVSGVLTSDDGSRLLALGADARLTLYDTPKSAVDPLDDCVWSTGMVLSPGGQWCAYLRGGSWNGGEDATLCLNAPGGEPVELGRGAVPVTVSDGGTLYYLTAMDADRLCDLRRYRDGEDSLLSKGVYRGNLFLLNRDATELLYTKDGKSYLLREGEEPLRVAEGAVLSLVLPAFAAPSYTYGFVMAARFPTGTLLGKTYYCSDGLWYLDRDGKSVLLAEDCVLAISSADAGAVTWYGKDFVLRRADLLTDPTESVTLAENVSGFYTDQACRTVCCQHRDGSLYYLDGDGGSVLVAEEADQWRPSWGGGLLCYLRDGRAWTYTPAGGSREAPLPTPALTLMTVAGGVVCYTYDGPGAYSAYLAEPEGDFTLLRSGLDSYY